MKRFFLTFLTILLLCGAVHGADTPLVTYNGGTQLVYTDAAGGVITGNGDFGTAFSSMLPGVTYSQSIGLRNTSSTDTVRFYMSLSVLETLKAAQLDGAGYTVTLTTTGQTLFSSISGSVSGTLIGGAGSTGELSDLNSALYSSDGAGILVATLAPGGSETLTLSILADATMSNAYQSASGTLEFQFFAELTAANGSVETVYIPGQTIYKTINTGEGVGVYVAAGLLLLAVVLLLVTGAAKKKQKG